jgi:chromosome partitioning protein
MIILIGGEKGGTGKSTLATNLAVGLLKRDLDVMLLDADPQATAAKWVERRNNNDLKTVHSSQKTGDVFRTAKDLAKRYDVVIIDAGGRDTKELRTAMVAADLMYIPIKASQADLETLPHVNELIGLAKAMNPGLVAKAILCMAPTNPSITEVADAKELLAEFDQFGLSSVVIRERKPFRDALLEGKSVLELTDGKAKSEVDSLITEIMETTE